MDEKCGQKREGRNFKNPSDSTLNEDKAGIRQLVGYKKTKEEKKEKNDRQKAPELRTARENSLRRDGWSLGFGAAEVLRPTAAKTLKQKDHLLEEVRRGGGMEG